MIRISARDANADGSLLIPSTSRSML